MAPETVFKTMSGRNCRKQGVQPEPLRVSRRLQLLRGWRHDEAKAPFSPEVHERAVRMVRDHESEHGSQWSAIQSIAAKIGCSGETLRNWVRQSS